MHHLDRRSDRRHMRLGEGPPAAADGVEDRLAQAPAAGSPAACASMRRLAAGTALGQQRLDRQRAERQADPALADLVVERLGDLEAAAAHVADEADRAGRSRR